MLSPECLDGLYPLVASGTFLYEAAMAMNYFSDWLPFHRAILPFPKGDFE